MDYRLEELVKSLALTQKFWHEAFKSDCPDLCDELEKLKTNYWLTYKNLGGKALQPGDLISFSGEVRWKLEDEY